MNYRHAFHAGNFADVIKHVALTSVLLHLKKKDKPFCFVDTHAGRGLYELRGEEAARTGEASEGIDRLVDLKDVSGLPPALDAYLAIVDRCGRDRYPGSSLIGAELARTNDRVIAIELHSGEAAALAEVLAPFPNAKVHCADGYAKLPALLPPRERRGVTLIDPPYEAADEFERVAQALTAARRRFATGIYILWHPIKSVAAADALSGELSSGGTEEILRIAIDLGSDARGDKDRLSAAGLLVVNPPYGFSDEMKAIAAILAPKLGRAAPAKITIENIDAARTR